MRILSLIAFAFVFGLATGFMLGRADADLVAKWNPLADWFTFPLFEASIGILFVYSLIKDTGMFRKSTAITATVTRGPESRAAFYTAFIMISLVLIHVVNSTSAMIGYKTVLHVGNFAFLVYLVFFSSWGRKKVIGILAAFRKWEER